MFCHKCGNKLPEGALFCQNCGEKVLIGGCDNKSTESAAITDRTPIKEESSTYSAPVNERTEQVYANEKQDKEFMRIISSPIIVNSLNGSLLERSRNLIGQHYS